MLSPETSRLGPVNVVGYMVELESYRPYIIITIITLVNIPSKASMKPARLLLPIKPVWTVISIDFLLPWETNMDKGLATVVDRYVTVPISLVSKTVFL